MHVASNWEPPAGKRKVRFKLIFAWYDIWVGFFWDRRNHILYFFPVPMLGLKISL